MFAHPTVYLHRHGMVAPATTRGARCRVCPQSAFQRRNGLIGINIDIGIDIGINNIVVPRLVIVLLLVGAIPPEQHHLFLRKLGDVCKELWRRETPKREKNASAARVGSGDGQLENAQKLGLR
jgi:hypothetical protein